MSFAFVARTIPLRGQETPYQRMVSSLSADGLLVLDDRFYTTRQLVGNLLSLTLLGQVLYPTLKPSLALHLGAFAGAGRQHPRVGEGEGYVLERSAIARGFAHGIDGLLGRPKDPQG